SKGGIRPVSMVQVSTNEGVGLPQRREGCLTQFTQPNRPSASASNRRLYGGQLLAQSGAPLSTAIPRMGELGVNLLTASSIRGGCQICSTTSTAARHRVRFQDKKRSLVRADQT